MPYREPQAHFIFTSTRPCYALEKYGITRFLSCVGAIAKWLRRQIRNLFLFQGAGSSPAGVVCFVVFFIRKWKSNVRYFPDHNDLKTIMARTRTNIRVVIINKQY